MLHNEARKLILEGYDEGISVKELAAGTFLIPSSVTVAEFLMDWLPTQCSRHKWAPKTYESNFSTIQNLIIPYIGSMEDSILHLAVHITLVGALREGEIVGLTPEDLDFDATDGIGTFRINKSMQRVRKEALNQVDDSFPLPYDGQGLFCFSPAFPAPC